MGFILILLMQAGPQSGGAIGNVPGFVTEEACTEAGNKAAKASSSSVKFVCVKVL
jgi:hypothetical protein